MRPTSIAAALLGGALLLPAVPAQAAPGVGNACTFTPLQLTTSPTYREGVLSGGPYVIPAAYKVVLNCRIVVNGITRVSATQASPGTAYLSPRQVAYFADGPAYLCSTVTWYYPLQDLGGGSANLGCKAIV